MDNLNPPTTERSPAGSPAYSPEVVKAAQRLASERLRFAVPTAGAAIVAYALIGVFTSFSGALGAKVHGAMSFTLLLLLLLTPFVWVLALGYRKRAERWDAAAEEIRTAIAKEGGR